jgi:hypothetical protein
MGWTRLLVQNHFFPYIKPVRQEYGNQAYIKMVKKIFQVNVIAKRAVFNNKKKEFNKKGDKNGISTNAEYLPEVINKISASSTAYIYFKKEKRK